MFALLLSVLLSPVAEAMPTGPFEVLHTQVDGEAFADDQLAVLQTAAAANTFTPAQTARLLQAFPFADDQLAALRVLSPKLEPGDTSAILATFTFSSDRDKAQALLFARARSAPEPGPDIVIVPVVTPGAPVFKGSPTVATTILQTPVCPTDASLPALSVNWTSTWTDAEFAGLLAGLEAESFSGPRLELLTRRIQARPEGLSGPQVLALLGAFDFSNDLEAVVSAVDDNLLGMTVAEVRQVLDAYTFADGKLSALTVLSDAITDVEHVHELMDAFTFSSDKRQAAAILQTVTPRSVLFGTVHSQRAVFVVDTSGSMEATFRTNQARSLSRLDFVRCELDRVLTTQLGPTTRFSIITFGDRATAWQPSLVLAQTDVVTSARDAVARLRPRGGTNMGDALRQAVAMNPDVIYFLTDGAPTAGSLRKASDLTALVSDGNAPVHAIAFLTGSHRSDNKTASRELMRALAESTGGVYRAIE